MELTEGLKNTRKDVFIMSQSEKNVNIVEQWEIKKRIEEDIVNKMFEVRKNKRALRMMGCSSYIELSECPSCKRRYVSKADLCRDRLCPICQWLLSRKRAAEMLKCLDLMNERQEYRYQFLTLTQKNVAPFHLRDELKKMSKAWNRVVSSRAKDRPAGYARVVEITYNEKSKTFHPHQHIIIAWDKSSKPYTRIKWQNRWRKAFNIKYDPICRLRTIKPKKGQISCKKATLEAYKYSVKTSDLLKMPNDVFRVFVDEISGTRSCSYTGIFRKIRQELKMGNDTEIENGEETQIQCNNCGEELSKMVLRWSFVDNKYIEESDQD